MSGKSQNEHITIELDPALLSTPYSVQTNWHVVTAASCSGKSTLINQLAGIGFKTVPEVAREYMEMELGKGRTIAEVRQDRAALTCQLYDLMLKCERGLRADEITFLDRAVPDALAYFRFAGMNPNEVLPDCFQNRYASVFLLERLPYQRNGVRAADDQTAAYFESWTERDYIALGYNVERVPVLSPEERLAFVLERISG